MAYTGRQLGYASTIVRVGGGMGVTRRGQLIALSTVLVETNLWNYANSKVPESLGLPHDAVGSDGMSVGLFQQQIRKGPTGQWWWSNTAACMDPATAARLFYEQLVKLPYNDPGRSPGAFAQDVQRSAFTDRYDQRMRDAEALYGQITGGKPMPDYGITRTMHGWNPTTCAVCTGNSNGPRGRTSYVVMHTQEGASDAEGLANYLNSTNSVSYNLVVDDHDTIEVVPVDEGPWAAVEANSIALHICVAGSFAAWSRDQWMQRRPSLERAAKAARAACDQYGIPMSRVARGNGWPASAQGIAGHVDFGIRGGGHHDPGDGFPYDEFISMVRADSTGTTESTAESTAESEDTMTPDQAAKLDRIHFELTERFQSRVEGSEYRDTLVGYALNTDAATYRNELAIAALRDQVDALKAQIKRGQQS